ncbi:prepilin-type N-terminal cleavage/methylation domain-containing protein [Vibrio sp. SCSIO 43135]|jgi:MSHA pilin protein MshB|uniref:Prepilin-type N-terminal cleavage/methylation domain-containing protein n=1 Tax=Vibrio paucivorans TaxID=2829489 RepID=A0A9X3HPZ8_9VIBR|nr:MULTISPECIES: prepilin-type N-terminal cleavage/methylation domain-containing protein [Vibrio]MCW8332457.1 prepilin-type N-terminal cleavage/methylation domain-containing protein [Vibrio paucivorans]USD41499.1 prepilin-type N-terminal cleavage/methylation domain-containing protein [Vibrio sp. SCSIO 43135]
MKMKQSGFSLVELVVVIVVVGLLAVAALPRFLDVTDEAKKASIEGVAGGFATGVLSARAQWEAEARPQDSTNTYNTVDYDGVDFWLTSSELDSDFRDGYPIALNNTGSDYPDAVTDGACIDLMENLLQNPPQVGTVSEAESDSNIKYSAQANGTDSTCTYVQKEGTTDHEFVYEIKTGRVTVTLQ